MKQKPSTLPVWRMLELISIDEKLSTVSIAIAVDPGCRWKSEIRGRTPPGHVRLRFCIVNNAEIIVPGKLSGVIQQAGGMVKITVQDFNELAAQRLPFVEIMGLQLQSVDEAGVWMRAVYSDRFLRPGGTIAGPAMMGLADAAVYALVLSRIGPVELAVTTSLNINFLRKPMPGDILARATPLKFGKRLVVADVALYSASQLDAPDDISSVDPVAHATATYSIPPA